MALDSAPGEYAHYRDGGRRRLFSGGAVAGCQVLAVTKGPDATPRAAPSPQGATMPPRRECRQVMRIFVVSLGIGFALTGAAAWSVATAPSAAPNVRAKTPAQAAGISVAANATNDAPSMNAEAAAARSFDAKRPGVLASALARDDALSSFAQAPAEQTDEVASVQSGLPRHAISVPVPSRPSHTAVYDIAAHTVYLPNGQTLEAHSGLGSKLDDPRYVKVKSRGPTPPNVYELTLRKKLFHKVRAIRLVPVGDASMFGRDGMLAHTYMRGASGESNGCVSFKNYAAFLRAYLKGEVDRLVVVPRINPATWQTAGAAIGPQLLDTD
jgi:hypothetical protein